MRVPDDIPLNPNPNDMVVGVEECWEPLVYLLFVRRVWQLEIAEVPALESEPGIGFSARRDTADSTDDTRTAEGTHSADGAPTAEPPADPEVLWRSDWARAWSHFGPTQKHVAQPDAVVQQMLDNFTDEELWAATSTWPSAFWDIGIDRVAYEAWRETLPAPAGELPEYRAIAALTDAWATGLTTIVVLPYAGYFAQRINTEHLVVSASTRRDPEEFGRALRG